MAFSPSSGTSLLPTAGHHHLGRHHGVVVSPTTSLLPSPSTSGRSAGDAWNVEDVSTVQRRTALSMSAAPVVTAGAGALAGCLSGGLFAGGLHAIAGKSIFMNASLCTCTISGAKNPSSLLPRLVRAHHVMISILFYLVMISMIMMVRNFCLVDQ